MAQSKKGGNTKAGGEKAAGSKPPSSGKSAGPAKVVLMAEQLPVAPSVSSGPVPLPEVKAPSTEGIEVTVPAPPPLSEDALIRRFHELARSLAEVRERQPGEEVVLGDDVQLDILGYSNGQLIPFSIRVDYWMELAPQEMLPGFADAIAGSAVGDSLKIDLVLPGNYPVESLRGMPATFLVDLVGAREVKMPDTDSDEFLRQLGRGNTHEEVMESIANELLDEQADVLWLDAQNMVLDELASRTQVELPPALVDEEIRRRWTAAEGPVMEEKEFSPEERQEALDVWMKDPATRADVERRLRISLALKAVAAKEKLELRPEKAFEVLEDSAAAFGLTSAQLREALVDPAAASQLQNVAWHLMVVEHVMDKAKVHFEGA
ncbi:trigger factor [Archangium lipolyticum]|uniref:peptidylprolyl isomerase n=1 Tax=Archangium lipolyticum TaxID=2970465 RepID=UPI00214A8958|nr:peptidylprolyl isomerase [Archangium lipolyticum]